MPVTEYQQLKSTLHSKILEDIDWESLNDLNEKSSREQVSQHLRSMLERDKTPLTYEERQQIVDEVLDELFGLGPMELLLADPTISDILINGPGNVYVERRGVLEPTNVSFNDTGHLMRIIERIVSRVGRRVDESSPMVDARLQDGSRVNVIIPPLSLDGPIVSIRRFGRDPLTADDLINSNSLTATMLDLLRCAVQGKLNILVSGGTGSGKTTLLNVLSAFIPAQERVVTIEDAAELQLRQEHVVRLETRPPNIEGKGMVKQRQLVINALRMRPDRIIVGEVRGEEAIDMLQAMNTGHDGSLTTVHANSPRDALTRLETMVCMANHPDRVKSRDEAAGPVSSAKWKHDDVMPAATQDLRSCLLGSPRRSLWPLVALEAVVLGVKEGRNSPSRRCGRNHGRNTDEVDCSPHVVGQSGETELRTDVPESLRQEGAMAHPLIDRTEGMFDRFPATIHHLWPSREAVRHPVHRGFVLVAHNATVGVLCASVAYSARSAGRTV